MSEKPNDAKATKAEVFVLPFTLEADHPRMCDLRIQNIPNLELRSAIDGSKGSVDKDGNFSIPADQAIGMAGCPKIPGMRIEVDPKELTYRAYDPLSEQPELLIKITNYLRKKRGIGVGKKLSFVPEQKGKLDKHQMKTLCRELVFMMNAKEMTLVSGVEPEMEDIEELPGRFIQNPGAVRYKNAQPRYEDQMEDHIERLHYGSNT